MSYASQLAKARERARAAQEMLYEGSAKVEGMETYIKPNGATGTRKVTFYDNMPCRVSYGNMRNNQPGNPTYYATDISQVIKLFCSPDVTIPAGSDITVTQNGLTAKFGFSQPPMKYATHQEIVLDLVQNWA